MSEIKIENLHVSFGSQKVLNGVEFQIRPGKILAFLGPNGAGKSTCMRVLAGLVHPEKGSVFLNGTQLDTFAELRKSCGYLIESADFYEYLSAEENLNLIARLCGSSIDPLAVLESVGLQHVAKKKVGTFSQGMKQRLGIAQTLIGDPEYLILDEPFNGLDIEIKQIIIALIHRLRNAGKGLLISTHLLEEMEEMADDFILLDRGKVHLSGNLEEFKAERQVVTFHFDGEFDYQIQTETLISKKTDQLSFLATREQAKQIMARLISQNQFPYKVEWSGVLRENYLKITQ